LLGIGALAIALTASQASGAEKKPEALAIKLSASFAPAASDVVVKMVVRPDPRARELTLEWVSDDLSGGSHAIHLEGEQAPTTHSYAIKKITEGDYVVTAILRLSDGTEVRREARVTVVGSGGGGGDRGGVQGWAGGRPATWR
jgi:hypothetical protein